MLESEFTMTLAELGAVLAALYAGPTFVALRYLSGLIKERDERIRQISEAHAKDLARFSELQRAYREDSQELIRKLIGEGKER